MAASSLSLPARAAVCGNQICENGEDPASCPQDCGCGNNVCNVVWEDALTCPQDCGGCNNNNVCECAKWEDCLACPGDCGPCGKEGACFNGLDDDGDCQIDCADSDCQGFSCDDYNKCTTGDTCAGGKCQGAPVICGSDQNLCTQDVCNPLTGCFPPEPFGFACDGGDKCKKGFVCDGKGTCDGTVPGCLPSDNPCEEIKCDPMTGKHCVKFNKPDFTGECDGDLCTIDDKCVAGKCTGGGAKVCDDKNPCTKNSCDPTKGCNFPPDLEACGCNLDGICDETEACPCPDCCKCVGAPITKYSAAIDLSFPFKLKCPALGGSGGVEVGISGSIEGQVPDCKNNCTGIVKPKLDASVNVELCKGIEFKMSAGLSLDQQRKYCSSCNLDTCEIECDELRYCGDRTTEAHAELEVSRFFGYENKFDLEDMIGFPLGFGINCGVTLEGKVGLNGSHQRVEDHTGGCMPCNECEAMGLGVTLNPSASAGCSATAKLGWLDASIGCDDCIVVDILLGGNVKKTCEGEKCLSAKLEAGVKYHTPTIPIGKEVPFFGFIGVKFNCEGEQRAGCTYATSQACGTTGCGGIQGDLIDCGFTVDDKIEYLLKVLGL